MCQDFLYLFQACDHYQMQAVVCENISDCPQTQVFRRNSTGICPQCAVINPPADPVPAHSVGYHYGLGAPFNSPERRTEMESREQRFREEEARIMRLALHEVTRQEFIYLINAYIRLGVIRLQENSADQETERWLRLETAVASMPADQVVALPEALRGAAMTATLRLTQRNPLYIELMDDRWELLVADLARRRKRDYIMNSLTRVAMDPEDRTCTICAVDYGTPDEESSKIEGPVQFPCPGKHVFGHRCTYKWLQENLTCPMCRHAPQQTEGE